MRKDWKPTLMQRRFLKMAKYHTEAWVAAADHGSEPVSWPTKPIT